MARTEHNRFQVDPPIGSWLPQGRCDPVVDYLK
jgi:hypothetical protein